jgi:hypothetical protein
MLCGAGGGDPWKNERKLLAAAYWALTMLEAAPGPAATAPTPLRTSKKRQAAASFLNIDLNVLNKIGELTSTRGGEGEERKAGTNPLSPYEKKGGLSGPRAACRGRSVS